MALHARHENHIKLSFWKLIMAKRDKIMKIEIAIAGQAMQNDYFIIA